MQAYPFHNRDSRAGQAVPRALIGLRAFREILVVAIAVLCYFTVRGVMDAREATALANADTVIALEQRLGLFWEPNLQRQALQINHLATIANWIYIWGHWPIIAVTLLWLLVRHRDVLSVYRNAMLISGAIGVICFALFPLAPPRFMEGLGFVDTVTLHSSAYRVLQPPSLTNQFAAMPSLHFGWNLLMGIAIWRHARGRLPRLFSAVMPMLMFVAIVLTANHYVLDGVAGMAVAVTGLGVASRFAARQRRTLPERATLAAATS